MIMADRLDDIIDSSVAAIVGIVMVTAALIPIASQMIGGLTGDDAQYAPLLGVVVIMVIVGLIVGVIRFYQSAKR